jgi:hypothetical protein
VPKDCARVHPERSLELPHSPGLGTAWVQASMWWPLQTAEVQLSVTQAFTVSRVVLELVNFRHNYAADVTVRLRAPSGALATIIEEPVRR